MQYFVTQNIIVQPYIVEKCSFYVTLTFILSSAAAEDYRLWYCICGTIILEVQKLCHFLWNCKIVKWLYVKLEKHLESADLCQGNMGSLMQYKFQMDLWISTEM